MAIKLFTVTKIDYIASGSHESFDDDHLAIDLYLFQDEKLKYAQSDQWK